MPLISDALIKRIETLRAFANAPLVRRDTLQSDILTRHAMLVHHINAVAELANQLPLPVCFLICRILVMCYKIQVGTQTKFRPLGNHTEVFGNNAVYDVTNYIHHFGLDDGIRSLRQPYYYVCSGEIAILREVKHIPHRILQQGTSGKLTAILFDYYRTGLFGDIIIINFENKQDAVLGRLLLP